MRRSVWIGLTAILIAALLGAFVLGRALEKTTRKPSLAPIGAKVLEKHALRGAKDERAVTWKLGGRPGHVASGIYGVTIWQGKRMLYAHRARPGAHGVFVETGDFTGDGRDDLLVFDDTDGRAGCGTYRALATSASRVQQVSARDLCVDDGSIHLQPNGLLFQIGQEKHRAYPGCCYRFVRTSLERWNGQRLVVVRSSRKRLPDLFAWPPGDTQPGRLRYCMRPGGPGNFLSSSRNVSCRTARQVEARMLTPYCSSRGRCDAHGFACVTFWNGRYGEPFGDVKHAICRAGNGRVEMDEG